MIIADLRKLSQNLKILTLQLSFDEKNKSKKVNEIAQLKGTHEDSLCI